MPPTEVYLTPQRIDTLCSLASTVVEAHWGECHTVIIKTVPYSQLPLSVEIMSKGTFCQPHSRINLGLVSLSKFPVSCKRISAIHETIRTLCADIIRQGGSLAHLRKSWDKHEFSCGTCSYLDVNDRGPICCHTEGFTVPFRGCHKYFELGLNTSSRAAVAHTLMRRDGVSWETAMDTIDEFIKAIHEIAATNDYEAAVDACADILGLEPDYLSLVF